MGERSRESGAWENERDWGEGVRKGKWENERESEVKIEREWGGEERGRGVGSEGVRRGSWGDWE